MENKPKRKSKPKFEPKQRVKPHTNYSVKDLCKAGSEYKANPTESGYADIKEMHSEFMRQSNPSQQDKDFAQKHMKGIPAYDGN